MKFPGYSFRFLTIAVGLLGAGLAIVLYILEDPSYSIFTNFISDLSVGPNGSDVVFFWFVLIMGTVISPFYLYLTRYLQKLGTSITIILFAFGFSVLRAITHVLIVSFPLDFNNQLRSDTHLVFGVLLFFFAGITVLIYTYLKYNFTSIPRYISVFGLIASILLLAFSIFLFLGTYTTLFDYNMITYLTEWSAFGMFSLWVLFQSIFFYQNPG
jgi:hypothetical protein